MRARGLYYRFMVVALLGLVAFGSIAGTAMADSAPGARGASLSATGAAAPSPGGSSSTLPPAHVHPVQDGGFENGPPPASEWKEQANTPCEWIIDPSGAWGIPAHSGTYAFWAGGYCGGTPNSDSVSQRVRVVASHPVLQFYAVYFRPDMDDGPDNDRFYVQVNGTTVFSEAMIQANDTYPDWVLETIDLSAYAGQMVQIRIGARSRGGLTGNVLVDDVGFGN